MRPVKPCCEHCAAVQHEGVQRFGKPTQLSLLHSDCTVHAASGEESNPPAFGTAHAQTKWLGDGVVISFTRHVVPVAQSPTRQHVSRQRPFSQSPERQSSSFPLHTAPDALPPVVGGVRPAFAAGTQ
jgi:hypothetical protein